VSIAPVNNDRQLAELVKQAHDGDPRAEEEIIRRHKDGVSIIIGRIVQNSSSAEDISQETFLKVLEKIRCGEVREPERLSGFICSIAKNLAIEHVRKIRKLTSREDGGNAEFIPDPGQDPFTRLLEKERGSVVLRIIGEMSVKRDRDLLMRYFVAEEPKDRICSDLGLTREQFNRVVFRALQRFKELYLKFEGDHRNKN